MNVNFPLAGHGLYAVVLGSRAHSLRVATEALAGGARLLQYLTDLTDEGGATDRRVEASALMQLCRAHAVPLIIGQDIAMARGMRANGIHLSRPEDVHAARSALGPAAIIGVSCCNSLADAGAAMQAGANYVSFGAFFDSPTRPMAPRASIDLLRQSADLGVPRVAIGGITPDNGHALVAAGADYLAVISALSGANDIRACARRLSDLYLPHRTPET